MTTERIRQRLTDMEQQLADAKEYERRPGNRHRTESQYLLDLYAENIELCRLALANRLTQEWAESEALRLGGYGTEHIGEHYYNMLDKLREGSGQ